MTAGPTTRETVIAGHVGDAPTARAALRSSKGATRAAALGALERLGALTDGDLGNALADDDPAVRRRAAALSATHPDVDLLAALDDPQPLVAEMAAWACGERERVDDAVRDRLISASADADDPLVREAAVAALGALGDGQSLPAIVAACRDKPAIRRRAVLALAPFLDRPEALDAVTRATSDRDWQVRQAAEDLLRAIGADPTP